MYEWESFAVVRAAGDVGVTSAIRATRTEWGKRFVSLECYVTIGTYYPFPVYWYEAPFTALEAGHEGEEGSLLARFQLSSSSTSLSPFHPPLPHLIPEASETTPMMPSSGNHALVFGASGISGWAIVNQLLADYPEKGVFSTVTALTNRPLPAEYAQWPEDPRLNVVSGLDLMAGNQEDLTAKMKEKIKNVESVSQVYFYCEFPC